MTPVCELKKRISNAFF